MKISKTVLNAIAKMNKEELHALNCIVVDAINTQARATRMAAKSQFSVGDKVSFNGKRGYVEGKIEKINKVNIVLRAGHTRWTVSPNLLNKV
jgi:hypothetical protein